VPWGHIGTTSDGSLRICCQANQSNSRGLLKTSNGETIKLGDISLSEAQNQPLLKKLRIQLLNGEWGDECVRCKREFNSGQNSRNIYERTAEWANDITFDRALLLTSDDGSINPNDFPISFVDLRFGNKCNLKCVMCSPTDSDRWYDDYVAMWGVTKCNGGGSTVELVKNNNRYILANNTMNWFESKDSWQVLELAMPTITKIYVAGGEPMIIDEHFDFLEKCILNDHAKHITVEYNSNISFIPERAWSLWKEFKEIIIGCSIDGIGKVNDLIRFPSKWANVERNLNKLYTSPGNFLFHMTASIQILNIWNFTDMIDYMMKSSNVPHKFWGSSPIKITPHPVHRPLMLNINILPDSFKEKIKDKFLRYMAYLDATNLDNVYGKSITSDWGRKKAQAKNMLNSYIKFMYEMPMSAPELEEQRSKFIYYMDSLDARRGTNWGEVCPEVYEATKEWRLLPPYEGKHDR